MIRDAFAADAHDLAPRTAARRVLYGAGSGAALATVVGVLVEVPVTPPVCPFRVATRRWLGPVAEPAAFPRAPSLEP